MVARRVTSLRYRLDNRNEHDHFDQVPPIVTTLGDFDLELRDGQLEAKPRRDYIQVRDARDELEPLLRDWEIAAALDRHDIEFVFQAGGVEEVAPDGTKHIDAELSDTVRVGMDAIVARFNAGYPDPPTDLRADPVLEQMLKRLRDGRSDARLLVMNANWMVTNIETEYGQAAGGSKTRQVAAAALNADVAILDKMGELAARNDPDLGRKAKGAVKPLSASEIAWLEAAMEALTRQIGRYNAGAHAAYRLAISDLPALP